MRLVIAILWTALLIAAPAALRASEPAKIAFKGFSAAGAAKEDVSFSIDEIRALPSVTFRTSTLWTDGVREFKGVPLKTLLRVAGAEGVEIEAVALNGYVTSIDTEDLEDEFPIIAYQIDGEPIPVREKGPFWIVYPYDTDARFRTESIFLRSVWQLCEFRVSE